MYIREGGIWKSGENYNNVNGIWKKASQYKNVNGIWKPESRVYSPVSFTSILRESKYGNTTIQSDLVEITSGWSGVGNCAVRSKEKLTLKAGDSFRFMVEHFQTSGSSGGQRGRLYLSTSDTFTTSTVGTTQIYSGSPFHMEGVVVNSIHEIKSDLNNVYIWLCLEGGSSYDTHIRLSRLYINSNKIF